MTSSLYQRFGAGAPGPVAKAVQTAQQMAGGNPSALYNQMLQTNPSFRRFVQDNQGKTPQQIAQEHGIDFGQIMRTANGMR